MKSPQLTNEERKATYERLQTDPFGLLCSKEYKEIILRITRKFQVKEDSKEEMAQEIMTRMLEKVDVLQKNYNPRYAHFKSYFTRVAYNVAVDLSRSAQKQRYFTVNLGHLLLGLTHSATTTTTYLESELELLNPDLEKLGTCLSQMRNQAKLILLLKLYSRSVIEHRDLQNFLPKTPLGSLQKSLKVIEKGYAKNQDKLLYQYIGDLLRNSETNRKKSSADALRKWLDSRITDLVDYMNCHSTLGIEYDREALRNLIHLYFIKNQGSGSLK